MNINFELYRIFNEVAKAGNISRAAEELHISQPAVTMSIKKLEEELGGTLFIRTRRGVELIEEGKEFYKYINQAVESISNAENKFSQLIHLETGVIKIGASTTLVKEYLMPYIAKFHKMYPNIVIQIITELTSNSINMLKNGALDFVVFNMSVSKMEGVIITPCAEVQDCFVCSKEYQKFNEIKNKKLSFKDLENLPLVIQPKAASTRKFLDNLAEKHNAKLNPIIEMASYRLVVELAKAGLGVGYVTKDYVKQELEQGMLYELKTTFKIPKKQIGIAVSDHMLPGFGARKFIDMIKEGIAERESEI